MSDTNPLDVQVGGDHYKKLKIQPMEYSMANGLDACQHTVVKYVTRFRDKGGIKDLEKAKHTIDLLIEFEKRGQKPSTTAGSDDTLLVVSDGLVELDDKVWHQDLTGKVTRVLVGNVRMQIAADPSHFSKRDPRENQGREVA